MPKSFGQTTAAGPATTSETATVPDAPVLIIVGSSAQPDRVGEVAFFPFGQRLFVGRGDVDLAGFAQFGRQRPGETSAVDPREALLLGDAISRRQLVVRSTGIALEMEQIGRCQTYVNGEERARATLHPGDTVLLEGELLLLCALRPKTLPPPWPARELQAFGQPDEDGIVGESPVIWRTREQLARVAATRDHVLVQGESGTGKELVAVAIHRRSDRATGPLVSRNASAFTASLLASELFGNPANYPNHGMPARKGLLGAADHGTFFLDEIGDCPLDAQTQLLRFMDHGEYQAVGDPTVRRADVRVVGATHRDDSFFRPDFLARFLARVRVPPLRERREDIPLLLRYFLLQRAQQTPEIGRFLRKGPDGRLHPNISLRLLEQLLHHPLPLNTRELHGVVLKAVETSPGDKLRMPAMPGQGQAQAQAQSTPTSTRPPAPAPGPALPLPPRDADGAVAAGAPPKEEVVACLKRERGNVARAARVLGIGRGALYRLMESYGIERQPVE